MSDRRLDWAIIPTAGRGTRMAPASAVIPKALLPVGTWPMLHWALDEAVEAEIGGVILVISPDQQLIREYLSAVARDATDDPTSDLGVLGRCLSEREVRWVEQPEPRGIGDAFMRCRGITGENPFAVLLPDNWFCGKPPAIAQVAETFWRTGLCTLGLTEVEPHERVLFGNVGGVELRATAGDEFRVLALQDKKQGTYGSDELGSLRGCARYVLGPEFYEALSAGGPPAIGEWDDVPAFQYLIEHYGLSGRRITARHYDVGLPAGYLAAASWLAARG